MTLEEILQDLPPELRTRLREASPAAAGIQTVGLARAVEVQELAVLDPLAGGAGWRATVEGLAEGLGPFRLKQLNLVYASAAGTLVSTQFLLSAARPVGVGDIGDEPVLAVGGLIRFPLIDEKRAVTVSAGGKLRIGEFVFDGPMDLNTSKILASAERGKVDFVRFRELPLMNALERKQAARAGAKLSDVFLEIRKSGGEFVVETVAASNARGDEETWA